MTGEQYRRYPKSLLMRQVTVDARDRDNRAERFEVVTTILDASIDGGQIGDLYERRWYGEVCQADCTSRFSLYPSAGSPHSGRGGVAASWPGGAADAGDDIPGQPPCDATTIDQSPPPAAGLGRRVRLNRLWEELPAQARHDALAALSRMVAQRLPTPPDEAGGAA